MHAYVLGGLFVTGVVALYRVAALAHWWRK